MRRADPLRFAPVEDMADPLLSVEDLRTHFRTPAGVLRAVDGVSFSLDRGKTLGIVGESGSGKTVLSRSVMGLLSQSSVDRSGRVLFAGHDLTAMGPRELRQVWGTQVSMIFQDPMTALNPVVRIGRQITESLRIRAGLDRAAARQTAVALLASVGIPSPERRLRSYPHELSGGMRQRVMIAIALSCGPKLVLADEPTTGLDVTIQAQILDLLSSEQRERSMAMVLVTHDLGVVAGRTDHIAVMYAGRIVESAPTAVVFRDTKMPYTEALIRSIPKLAAPSHTRLLAIEGRPPSLLDPPEGCAFAPRCPYADDRCHREAPPLREASPGHLYACWNPVGTPAAARAFEANRQAGLPAAVAYARSGVAP